MNIKKLVRNLFGRLSGVNALESRIIILEKDYKERIDTLHYFLNSLVDIKGFPKDLNKDLRIMQLCDVQLLRIVCTILSRNKITHWLDYGTLLGAYRHGGFIPWDDDMDITILIEDYQSVNLLLEKELSLYGIEVTDSLGRIGIGYKHLDTGIWLDIFPDEHFYSDKSHAEVKLDAIAKNDLWVEMLFPIVDKLSTSEKANLEKKVWNFPGEGKNTYYMETPWFIEKIVRVHPETNVFPLGKISFEGYNFNCPHEIDKYLSEDYGPSFMSFPKSGVLHHDLGRGPLSTWAKRSGTNMEEVYTYLRNIADSLEINEGTLHQ